MADNVMKLMKDNDVEFVDLRFTDPRGKLQHVTFDKSMIDADFFEDGQMFDGSSVAGWKALNHTRGRAAIILNTGVNHRHVKKLLSLERSGAPINQTNNNHEVQAL